MLAMECSKSMPRSQRRGSEKVEKLSGGDSGGDPPVPIPNTEVKPVSADGTWGEDPRESRTPPDTIREGRPDRRGGPSAFWAGIRFAGQAFYSASTGPSVTLGLG